VSVVGPVDAMLQEAARLLGTGPPPTVAIPTPPSPNPPHPQWEGDASEQARQVSTRLSDQRDQLHTANVKTATLINNAATITTDARTQIAGIQSEWERDKAAVGAFSNTPAGQAALATAGQTRVQEATGVITDAVNRFGQAAAGVQAAGFDLPMKMGPGDLPLEPQFGDDPSNMTASQAQSAYEDLKREIDAHNARPPAPGTESQYNAEAASLNARKAALEARLRQLGVRLDPAPAPGSTPAPRPPSTQTPPGDPGYQPAGPVPSGGIRSVESGRPGAWNPELNAPLPNTRYYVDGGRYIFDTDANGLTKTVHINIEGPVDPGARGSFVPPGMLPGDQAGHLVPARLGGPGELIDLTAQTQGNNLSTVKIIENQWAKQLQEMGGLHSSISIVRDATGRPTAYYYQWLDQTGSVVVQKVPN
jgi:DNA/RNA non-specific endonuclease